VPRSHRCPCELGTVASAARSPGSAPPDRNSP
jgi:hypothetical protein